MNIPQKKALVVIKAIRQSSDKIRAKTGRIEARTGQVIYQALDEIEKVCAGVQELAETKRAPKGNAEEKDDSKGTSPSTPKGGAKPGAETPEKQGS